MCMTLAVMHWNTGIGIDANDVWVCSRFRSNISQLRPLSPSQTSRHLEIISTWQQITKLPNFKKRTQWMLDFNQSEDITKDKEDVNQAVQQCKCSTEMIHTSLDRSATSLLTMIPRFCLWRDMRPREMEFWQTRTTREWKSFRRSSSNNALWNNREGMTLKLRLRAGLRSSTLN